MVSSQHNGGVSRSHCSAHSTGQKLTGSSDCAWEWDVHKGLILVQVLEAQVSKVMHRVIYNKTVDLIIK